MTALAGQEQKEEAAKLLQGKGEDLPKALADSLRKVAKASSEFKGKKRSAETAGIKLEVCICGDARASRPANGYELVNT